MSSTETEHSQECFSANAKWKPKPKAKRKAARNSRLGARCKKPDAFMKDFNQHMSDADKYNRGCLHCSFERLKKLQKCLGGLLEWRDEFHKLPGPVAEKELLWIFRTARPVAKAPGPVKRKQDDVQVEGDTTETEESDHGRHQKKGNMAPIQQQRLSSLMVIQLHWIWAMLHLIVSVVLQQPNQLGSCWRNVFLAFIHSSILSSFH